MPISWGFSFLADDNEFEEVNMVRANDFYQSRDADGGSSW